MRETLHIDLDFDTPGLTLEERKSLLDWYQSNHGQGDMELNKFVEFLLEYYPAGLKRFRRHAIELSTPDAEGNSLPPAAFVLMFLNLYAAHHRERETLYEIILCRNMGVSKAEVVDTLKFSFLSSGPAGINAVAERCKPVLDAWVDVPKRSTIQWPSAWAAGSRQFDSSLNQASLELSDIERQVLEDWHIRINGEVPRYAGLLAGLHPSGYKSVRLRLDGVFDVLPAQMIPLFMLTQATYNVWPSIVRRATVQALGLGVHRHHIIQTILYGALDGGEWKLEPAIDAVGDLLDAATGGEAPPSVGI